LNFDAQYAIIGGKFFGAKNDDLSKFQITFIKKEVPNSYINTTKGDCTVHY
jgi:hypothetical protein